MSMLGLVYGNEETLKTITVQLAQNQLSHAVLLCAPDGCGRNFAAQCLAATWLYPNGGQGAQAVLKDESPECIVPKGEGASGRIPVRTIRNIRSQVHKSSLSATGRAVIIKNAHTLNKDAYNALLTVLEEPPANVFFILTAQSAGAMPATIASRCARYTLSPLSQKQFCQMMLEQVPQTSPETALMLASVYGFKPGLGLCALKNPARMAVLQHAISIATAAAQQNEYAMLAILQSYEGKAEPDKQRREDLLFDITSALQAALTGQTNPALPQMPPSTAALLLKHVLNARTALNANALPKITFTCMAAALINQT